MRASRCQHTAFSRACARTSLAQAVVRAAAVRVHAVAGLRRSDKEDKQRTRGMPRTLGRTTHATPLSLRVRMAKSTLCPACDTRQANSATGLGLAAAVPYPAEAVRALAEGRARAVVGLRHDSHTTRMSSAHNGGRLETEVKLAKPNTQPEAL